MAIFYNQATLTYNNTVTNSNIVTGELVGVLSIQKQAIPQTYRPGDIVTYVVSLTNGGQSAAGGLTMTDDLGAYTVEEGSYTPLTYDEGSVRYYVNGVLQEQIVPSDTTPLTFSNLSIPAGGNGILVYRTVVNEYAPPATDGSITNTASVTGNGLTSPVSASETITAAEGPFLSIAKAISPATVSNNDVLTYTFTIQNIGNTEVVATDDATVTDTFSPILSNLAVTFNGTPWSEPANYTYDETTGEFATVPGQITVPAATYTRDPETGIWTITPGTVTLVVRGTV